MNLVNSLVIVAVISIVILAVNFLRQINRARQGRNYIRPGGIFVNWVLVLTLVVSLAGVGYEKFSNRQVSADQTATKVPSTSKSTETVDNDSNGDQNLQLRFRDDVTMDSDGVVRLKVTVSAGAKVTVQGANTGKKYAGFTVPSGSGTVTRTVVLDSTGPYKVVASRGSKKVTKHLIVRDSITDDSTSTSSSESSSISTASSSSASSSSVQSSSDTTASQATTNQTASSSASTATTVGQ